MRRTAWLRRALADRLWRVPVLQRLGYAAVGAIACYGTPSGLRAGRAVPPALADELPVALVILLGADSAEAARVADAFERAQRRYRGFRPVFLLDRPVFAPLRRAGYPVEHAVPREEWERRYGPGSWPAYVGARVRECRRSYRAAATVCWPVRPGGAATTSRTGATSEALAAADAAAASAAEALAAVTAAAVPAPGPLVRRTRRWRARVQAALDRPT